MKLEVKNSFCVLHDVPLDVLSQIKALLTYKDDSIESQRGQLFHQMKSTNYWIRRCEDERNEEGLKENKIKLNQIKWKIKELEGKEWVCLLSKENSFPTGLINLVVDLLSMMKVSYEKIDSRIIPAQDCIFRWKTTPKKDRYYQMDMIKAGLENHRGVFEAAVGTGKSWVIIRLIMELSTTSLVVVPSSGLNEQLYQDLVLFFGEGKVEQVDTKKVRAGKKLKDIRITTVQTLGSLQKSGDLNLLTGDVNALFLDEFHHAGSNTYTNLLPEIEHIYYRFGFTGTFLRNDSKILELWGFLSNKLYSYPAWKATQEGYLTPLEVNIYNLKGKKAKDYQKEYDFNYCKTEQSTNELLHKIEDIILTADPNEQILILVNKKDKAGKIIHEYLEAFGIENSYISGDDKKETIVKTIRAFNDKQIRILIGSTVIGEGIDVRATDHLIMAQGGKSEIAIVQATGRGVRIFPGKVLAKLHDFRFNGTQYLEKHLEARLDIYKNNFAPTFKEHVA